MLDIKFKSITGFKEFHEADTVEPKDEKLNFTDFKTLVSAKYPDASEDVLKAAFDKATNVAETITFEQYD